MNKAFLAILTLTVAALIGIFVVFGNSEPAAPAQQAENPVEITAQDHVKGSSEAPVTLLEYADFQCPACRDRHPSLKELSEKLNGTVRIVYRHFPLTSIHPNAFPAARAAEAAAAQGKFFEMHDLLYERQGEWSNSTQAQTLFRNYAQELGLNLDQFTEVYNSNSTTETINRDIATGQQLNVQGTPTFFINGELVEENLRTYDDFKAAVEARL